MSSPQQPGIAWLLPKPVGLCLVRNFVDFEPVDLIDELIGDQILGFDFLLDHAPLEQKIQIVGVVGLGALAPAFHPTLLKRPIWDACLQHPGVIADRRRLIFSSWPDLGKDFVQDADGSLRVRDGEDSAFGVAARQSDRLYPVCPQRVIKREKAITGKRSISFASSRRSLTPAFSTIAYCVSNWQSASTCLLLTIAAVCAPSPATTILTSLSGSIPAMEMRAFANSTPPPIEITPMVLPLRSLIVRIELSAGTASR